MKRLTECVFDTDRQLFLTASGSSLCFPSGMACPIPVLICGWHVCENAAILQVYCIERAGPVAIRTMLILFDFCRNSKSHPVPDKMAQDKEEKKPLLPEPLGAAER